MTAGPPQGGGARRGRRRPRRSTRSRSKTILKRNIFCSTCPPILAKPEDGDRAAAARRRCSGPRCPEAAGDHVRAAARGSALVGRDHARHRDKTRGPYGIGAKIRDATDRSTSHEIACISTSITAGRSSTSTCSTGRERAAAAARRRRDRRRRRADPLAAELDKGIKKIGEHNYEVQRATLDSLLGNMACSRGRRASCPRSATARRPASGCTASGPTGRSRRSACRTATSSRAINGLEMTSPDKALRGLHEAQDGEPPLGRARTQRPESHQGLQHPMRRRTRESCRGRWLQSCWARARCARRS